MVATNKKTSPEITEAMFKFWNENACQDSLTGKEFSVSRQTISNIKKRDGWVERFKQIRLQVQTKTDDGIAKAISQNLRSTRALKTKLLLRLLDKERALDGGIAEAIKLMEYEDRLLGIAPDEIQNPAQIIFNIIERMTVVEQSELDTNLEIFYGNGRAMEAPFRLSEVITEPEREPGAVSPSNRKRDKAKIQ